MVLYNQIYDLKYKYVIMKSSKTVMLHSNYDLLFVLFCLKIRGINFLRIQLM